MTPRINDFSETLLSQLKHKNLIYTLKGDGHFFDLLHPGLIKCKLIFDKSPEELVFRDQSSGWNVVCFAQKKDAEDKISGVKSYEGFPWQIFQFLSEKPSDALIHFGHLGSVYLSKNTYSYQSSPHKLHDFILPIWLDYALSPELWGPAGKWIRFHERLHTLFENNGLLIGQDYPGFYPLKKEAQWLERHGFLGKSHKDGFDFIFTWDFPLSGLVELEKVLARGP